MKKILITAGLVWVLLTSVIVAISCGGGGGGGGASSSGSSGTDTSQTQTTSKTITIDLADFGILDQVRSKQRNKSFSKLEDIANVQVTVTVDGRDILKNFKLTRVSGTIYKGVLEDMPTGKPLTLEIKATDSNDTVIFNAVTEQVISPPTLATGVTTTVDEEPIKIPVTAVFEFQGIPFTQEEIKEIEQLAQSGIITEASPTVTETIPAATSETSNSSETVSPPAVVTDPGSGIRLNLYLIKPDAAGYYTDNTPQHLKFLFRNEKVIVNDLVSNEQLAEVQAIAYGRESTKTILTNPAISLDGAIMTHKYSGFRTWYSNSAQGLEQGFIIDSKPSGQGQVVVDVDINADHVDYRGDHLLIYSKGKPPVHYGKLKVFDATGKILTSNFNFSEPNHISIRIDDAGATYPVTVDPTLAGASIKVYDDDSDGKLDKVTIDFTDTIASGGTSTDGWTVKNSAGGTINISSASAAGMQKVLNLDVTSANLYENDTSNYIEVTYTSNPANTNTVFSGGDELADIPSGDATAESTEADLAKPVFVSTGTQYMDGSGSPGGNVLTVIRMIFSEDVTYTYNGGDWSLTPNNMNGISITGGNSLGAAGNSLEFSVSVPSDNTGIDGGTQPSIAYTPGDIQDGSLNSMLAGSVSFSDNVAPSVIGGKRYFSSSGNIGIVDRIELIFSESVYYTTSDANTNWTVNEGGLTGLSISDRDSSNLPSNALNLVVSTANVSGVSGGTKPTISYSSNQLSDMAGNAPVLTNVELEDYAYPWLYKVAYEDSGGSGTIDRVTAYFGENIEYSGNNIAHWTLTENGLTGLSLAGTWTINSDNIAFDVTASPNITGVSATTGIEPTLSLNVPGGNASGHIRDDQNFKNPSYDAMSMTDNASPKFVVSGANYQDLDNDGMVDWVTLTFSENVSYLTYVDGNWTVTANNLTSLDVTAGNTSDNNILYLTATAATNLTGVSGGNEPGITFGGTAILDDNNNVMGMGANVTLTDNAMPVAISGNYVDLSGNGTVDRVRLMFSENIYLTTFTNGNWTETANDLTGFDVSGVDSTSDNQMLSLNASVRWDLSGVSGGTEPQLSGDNAIVDSGNNMYTSNTVTLSDNTTPLVLYRQYWQTSGNGMVNEVRVVYGEQVSYNSYEDADWTVVANDITGLDVLAGTVAASNTLTLTASATANITGVGSAGTEPTLAYDSANGTSSIFDASNMLASSFTATSLSDNAVVTAISTNGIYYDLSSNGQIDTVKIDWTEEINTGTITPGDFVFAGSDSANFAVITSGDFTSSTNSLFYTESPAGNTHVTDSLRLTHNGTTGTTEDLHGNRMDTFDVTLSDNAMPVVVEVDFGKGTAPSATEMSGKELNIITVTYSEPVILSKNGDGAGETSAGDGNITTTAMGNLTSAKTLAGIGSWTGTDDTVTNAVDDNYMSLDSAGNVLIIYFNSQKAGFFSANTNAPSAAQTFTVESNADLVRDVTGYRVNNLATATTTVSTAWDVAAPVLTFPGPATNLTSYYDQSFTNTYSENVIHTENTSNYAFANVGGYTVSANVITEASANTVFSVYTSERLKSGNLDYIVYGISTSTPTGVRDMAGNPLPVSSKTYSISVNNILDFGFSNGGNTNSVAGSSISGNSSGAANIITYEHRFEDDAVNLSTSGNFWADDSKSSDNLNNSAFPQYSGTLKFWIKPLSVGGANVFDQKDATRDHFYIVEEANGSGNYQFGMQKSDNTIIGGANIHLNANIWNFIALTWDLSNSGAVNLYVNGSTDQVSETMGNWLPDDQMFVFTPKGHIDELKLHDQVYGYNELYTEYNNYRSGNIDFANVFSDNTVDDASGYNNNAYLFGSPSQVQAHHDTYMGIDLDDATKGFDSPLRYNLFPTTGSLDYWVYPLYNVAGNQLLLDEKTDHRNQFYLKSTNESGIYEFGMVDTSLGIAGNVLATASVNIHINTWNHIALNWTAGANTELYINGDRRFNQAMGAWVPDQQIVSSTPFGVIQDFVINNTNLPSSNINDLWITYSTPQVRYDFTDGNYSTVYTTDTLGYHHRAIHGGGVPDLEHPHYGVTSGNSFYFGNSKGFTDWSLQKELFPQTDGTVMFWFQPRSSDNAQGIDIFDKDETSPVRDHFNIISSANYAQYDFGIVSTTASGNLAGTPHTFDVIPERMNHIAITWSSNGGSAISSLYVNGYPSLSANISIANWWPTGQIVSSTPNGYLDSFYIDPYPWTETEILSYYQTYINSYAFYYFDNADLLSGNAYVDDHWSPGGTNYGQFSSVVSTTEGHHNPAPTGEAQVQDPGVGFWVPSLDYSRFPQEESTLMFWVKPKDSSDSTTSIFDMNENNRNHFFIRSDGEARQFYFGIEDKTVSGGNKEIGQAEFELHTDIFNHLAITWTTNGGVGGGNINFYVNAVNIFTTEMGTWRPSEQYFISTPNGVLDDMILHTTLMSATDIRNYFTTYVTPQGLMTFDGETPPQITDTSNNYNHGLTGGSINTNGGHHSQGDSLTLTTGEEFSIPTLLKDLFPQDEGLLRFWFKPNGVTGETTKVLDEYDAARSHFYIISSGNLGQYTFAIQDSSVGGNLHGEYTFHLQPDDWNLLGINWSSDRGTINLMVNGHVMYTTEIGSWRPTKQIVVTTPDGEIDDFYVTDEYESVHTVEDYYEIYETTPENFATFIWGNSLNGQLGDGQSSYVTTPKINHDIINVTTIASKSDFTVGILNSGTLVTWGRNNYATLANNTTTDSFSQIIHTTKNGFVDVACGTSHAIGLKTGGNIFVWGRDNYGQLGEVPITRSDNLVDEPTILPTLGGASAIAAGNAHNLALVGGAIKSWGANTRYQLGNGSNSSTNTIQTVSGLGGVTIVKVACGLDHNLALDSTGKVWGWGRNDYGQVGDGTTTDVMTPTGVSGLTSGVTDISAGDFHSVALKSDNTIVAWGLNDKGQLGNNSTTNSKTPVSVVTSVSSTALSNATAISAGGQHTLALLIDRTLMSWGAGTAFQLGSGKTLNSTIAANVLNVQGAVDILAAGEHSFAIVSYSSYYGTFADAGSSVEFDDNTSDDTGTYHHDGEFTGSPTKITGNNSKGLGFEFQGTESYQQNTNNYTSFPQDRGTVKLWYKPNSSTTTNAAILDATDATRNHFQLTYTGSGQGSFTAQGAGITDTFGLTVDQWNYITFAWESASDVMDLTVNGNVELSNQSFGAWRPTAQLVVSTPAGGFDKLSIEAAYENTSQAQSEYTRAGNSESGETTIAWGFNANGELGDGTTTNQNAPVTITSIDFPKSIAIGSRHRLVLYSDGKVASVGVNDDGQLGHGDLYDRNSLQEISGITTASAIGAGDAHSVCLLSDGTVKAWGHNRHGQVGSGNSEYKITSPVDIGLSGISKIAVGAYHSMALDSGGNVWVWGLNSFGQLGTGTTSTSSTPTKLTTTGTVTAIGAGYFHSLAVKSDATVLAWGLNDYYQLGDSSTNTRTSPVAVSSVTGAMSVSAGAYHSMALLSADGSIMSWGRNDYGQLGQGNITTYGNPGLVLDQSTGTTLIGTDRTGKPSLQSGSYHNVIIMESDGSLKSWGRNDYGQLGLGNNENQSRANAIGGTTGVQSLSTNRDSNIGVSK